MYDFKTPQYTFPSNYLFNITYELSIESIAFATLTITSHLFKFGPAPTFGGISLSLIASKVLLKTLNHYNHSLFIHLNKEACKLTKQYPRLQLISFLAALILGTSSKKLGFCAGMIVGSFGAIILDVEKYKRIRK